MRFTPLYIKQDIAEPEDADPFADDGELLQPIPGISPVYFPGHIFILKYSTIVCTAARNIFGNGRPFTVRFSQYSPTSLLFCSHRVHEAVRGHSITSNHFQGSGCWLSFPRLTPFTKVLSTRTTWKRSYPPSSLSKRMPCNLL